MVFKSWSVQCPGRRASKLFSLENLKGETNPSKGQGLKGGVVAWWKFHGVCTPLLTEEGLQSVEVLNEIKYEKVNLSL
jgi:hypothetical protein